MVVPTVHLNGDIKAELIRQNVAAKAAVQKAIDAVQAAAPHGRNYPDRHGIAGDEQYRLAVKEHATRIHRLTEVLNDYDWMIEYIFDQK